LRKAYLGFRVSPLKGQWISVKVYVRLFTTLRELTGKREETLDFDARIVTVEDVLKELTGRYGKEFKEYLYNDKQMVRGYLQLLVNGKSVELLERIKTRLKEGDEVAIVPPVGGG
jgi:molybdopterin synthase sulfur carrier subunit